MRLHIELPPAEPGRQWIVEVEVARPRIEVRPRWLSRWFRWSR